jgi:hypothetical protein
MKKIKYTEKQLKKMLEDENENNEVQAGTDLNALRILGVLNTTSKKCWCNPKIIKPKSDESV